MNISNSRSGAALVWILGFQLLLVLPFVGQPMHMDDHIYVDMGRNVLETPWHAHDFPYCFEGVCVPDIASHSHPPFVSYWIGLLMWVIGDGGRLSVTLHLGFLIFPMLFAVGMYRLALRFSGSPRLATLVAVASPAATVMSHNLMADYPTLAFWTLGTALYIDGVDQERKGFVWTSAIFLALAAFTSYPALAAAGLCWIYSLLKGSRMRAAYLAPFLAVAFMAAWLTYSSVYFGRFVIAPTVGYFVDDRASLELSSLIHKLLGLLILLVPTLAVPLPLVRFGLTWLGGRGAVLWTMVSAALTQMVMADYSLAERFGAILMLSLAGWTVLGLTPGIRMLISKAGSNANRQDLAFLLAWSATITLIVLFVYASASARYALPLLPPLVLLAFFSWSSNAAPTMRRLGLASLSISVVVGLTLSVADLEAARVPRDLARTLGETLEGWEDRTRFGGEWGFRYYMEQEGFSQFVSTSDDFTGGQFIVTPHQAVPYTVGQDVASMLIPIGEQTMGSGFPIRLMNRDSHAGFYSSGWGLLPFWFSRDQVEGVTIQQVSYLVERLPEIRLEGTQPLDAAIPLPVPEGGIDLVLPVPVVLSFGFDMPPARIQFSCHGANGETPDPCPVTVFFETDGGRTEVPLERGDDDTVSFVLNQGAGSIALELLPGADSRQESRLTIRNWTVLPLGWQQ